MIPVLLLLAVAPLWAEFRAAASKVDITPKTPQWLMGYAARQSTGVNDPIFHRVAVLDDGTTQVVIVASDVCVFSPSVYDEMAGDVRREFGLEPKQFWWTATHTHSAPEVGPPGVYDVLLKGRSDHEWSREYLAEIKSALRQGIAEARAKLVPARLAVGTGRSNANINRRARDLDGTISLGYNPDGPVDRQIGLLRIERTDGTAIALLANYAMHGTAIGGQSMVISGDAPGAAAAYVEQKLGAPVLYVNGAAGNIAPIYTVMPSPRAAHLGEFRVLLGDRILAANASLSGPFSPKLRLQEKIIETPRRAGLGWPSELGAYAGEGSVRIPVRFLALGDAILWGAPVELFCEIAMRVRDESPFRNTFFFGYTNGWLGYLPTAAAFGEGGYEPRTSPFTERVERDFGDGVITAIAGMKSSGVTQ
jgi:neutral ceramidase